MPLQQVVHKMFGKRSKQDIGAQEVKRAPKNQKKDDLYVARGGVPELSARSSAKALSKMYGRMSD